MRLRQIVADNPLAGRPWGVYEGDGEMAWAPYARASGETRTLLGKIALAPKAKWFGGWISNAEIGEKVRGYIDASLQQAGSSDALVQMSVFRMHPWEDEACHRLPTAAEGASYRDWIDRFADAVGDTHAAIILQPDGPFALCAPHGSHVPSDLIAYASRVLSALPHTSVYIDVGAADWPIESQGGVGAATRIAIQGGVQYARGIALNTTHYSSTVDEVQRGADVVRALADQGIADKHFVVNTSSNGKGFVFGDYRAPDPDNARVCDSQQDPGPCVALGIPPTYDFADPRWGLPQETVDLANAVRRRVPLDRPALALRPERAVRGVARPDPGQGQPLVTAPRSWGSWCLRSEPAAEGPASPPAGSRSPARPAPARCRSRLRAGPAVRLPSTVAVERTSSSNAKTRPRSRSSVCCWNSVIIPARHDRARQPDDDHQRRGRPGVHPAPAGRARSRGRRARRRVHRAPSIRRG